MRKSQTNSDNWNIENFEITSKSVERILEPLVSQVSILVHHNGVSSRKKGFSKQADTIMKALDDMLKDYVARGEEIMAAAPDRQGDFRAALDDVRRTGQDLRKSASVCLDDSCDIAKRKLMINATKAMLSAVTRLMILADFVDVFLLLGIAQRVENTVQAIKEATDLQALVELWKQYGSHTSCLLDMAGSRQKDLIDERKKTEIAAARGILRLHTPMLLTTSKAYIRHPELASAKTNRDYVVRTITDAVQMIITANKGSGGNKFQLYEKPGEFSTAIDEFDKHALMRPDRFNETEAANLSKRLSQIIEDSSVLASSPCTRDNHKKNIVRLGQDAEKNLARLLQAYRSGAGDSRRGGVDKLRETQSQLLQSTDQLRVELKRAVADHISDTFLSVQEPLDLIVDAAKSGNEDRLESVGPYMSENMSRLVEVANLACSVSPNYSGVQVTRLAASHVEKLSEQGLNAARVLVLRPSSKFAQENMDVFQRALSQSLTLLSESVDNITDIWDHLAVMDAHMTEDVTDCIRAAKLADMEALLAGLRTVRLRAEAACSAAHGEMEQFAVANEYRRRVEACLTALEARALPELDRRGQTLMQRLRRGERTIPESDPDLVEFADAAEDVGEALHELWRAVVCGRDVTGYETDIASADGHHSNIMSGSDSEGDLSAHQENLEELQKQPQSEKTAMRLLSGQHRAELEREMAGFYEQRKRLLHEMTKWDDSSNELVVLAKSMCRLLLQMTDFTQGRGPLHSTMEVIEAASKISDSGNQFNAVAAQISAQCPSSSNKSDLDKYMERVALYCHQIKITSRVKADIQNVGGEVVVSGLDSVTSLIEAGKNLMAAVVETVKSSYIASTKYTNKKTQQQQPHGQPQPQPVVQWRMKAPKKKPLVTLDSGSHGADGMRRSARYDKVDPNDELAQFH